MNKMNDSKDKITFLEHQISQLIQQMMTMTEKLNNQELKTDQAIQKTNQQIKFHLSLNTPIH